MISYCIFYKIACCRFKKAGEEGKKPAANWGGIFVRFLGAELWGGREGGGIFFWACRIGLVLFFLKDCTLAMLHGHDRAGIIRPTQKVSCEYGKIQSMWPKLLGS